MDRLDEIIRDVVYNQDIKTLIIEHFMGKDLSQHPLREFVQFQINECEDAHKTKLEIEGFQIGEPWNGDILNAPILFLSSNPAFNFYEASPRFKLDLTGHKIVMPAHENNPEENVNINYIKNFLRYRILFSPAKNNRDITLRIPLRSNTFAKNDVPYWGCARNIINSLLPTGIKKDWKAEIQNGDMFLKDYARKLMKYAVCMEIIPFKSNNSIGVNQSSIDYCWDNFTENILNLSGASIFILVGQTVMNVFAAKIFTNTTQRAVFTQTLQNGNIYPLKIGGRKRLIVSLSFIQGKIRKPTNQLTNASIQELRSTFAKAI